MTAELGVQVVQECKEYTLRNSTYDLHLCANQDEKDPQKEKA